jgi:hypothetical protein
MGSIFSPKMPPLPPVPEPVAIPERAAVERKRRGRKSTILTGSLTPEAEAAVKADKTLLGDA